ncbi:NLRC3 [Symbiodinium necroappetens]|uniref:NLRC3 protein n=1 Tax=Symbiodinium necroappetens TaxID=1628268 RepID=A0A813A9H4_9DINO|nr:NLRC3 [Symbiodinium necroappetens]
MDAPPDLPAGYPDVGAQKMDEDYDLTDLQGLLNFLRDANILLIRGQYLKKLLDKGRAWPRRQELEQEALAAGGSSTEFFIDGHTMSKMPVPSDWTKEGGCPFVAISHCWEAREHPDPSRHQLRLIVQQILNLGSPTLPKSWLMRRNLPQDYYFFIDFMSLYQYERSTDEQNRSFQAAMRNMQVIYCHEWTQTWRIESLAPETEAEAASTRLEIWDDAKKKMRLSLMSRLTANRTPYRRRGWCAAELQWSKARSDSEKTQIIDNADVMPKYGREAPMPPNIFEARVAAEELVFTHRGDAKPVLDLQAKIFNKKAQVTEVLFLQDLPQEELKVLAAAIPLYPRLKRLELRHCEFEAGDSRPLLEALFDSSVQELHIEDCENLLPFLEAWRRLIEERSSSCGEACRGPASIFLRKNNITDSGAQIIIQALRRSSFYMQVRLEENLQEATLKSLRLANAILAIKFQQKDKIDLSQAGLGDSDTKALAEVLKSNSTIAEINLDDNKIGDSGAQALAEVFMVHPSIMRISLNANEMGLVGAQALARAIELNPSIKSVELSDSQIGDHGRTMKLAHAISAIKFRERVEVDLTCAGLGDSDAQALAEAIKMGSAIESIDLGSNQIGDVGAQGLAEAFKASPSLHTLRLRKNRVGDMGAQSILQAIQDSDSFKQAFLEGNQIQENTMKDLELANQISNIKFMEEVQIANVTINIKTVRVLTLSCMRLDDSHAEVLAEAIKVSSSIESVDLSSNHIGSVGARALAEALKVTSSVRKIDLSSNYIGDPGGQALAEAVKASPSLQWIDLTFNHMNDKGVKAVSDAIRDSSSEKEALLKGNVIQEATTEALEVAQVIWQIRFRTAPAAVCLRSMRLEDPDAKALAEAVKMKSSVRKIDLCFNQIGDAGAQALAEAIRITASIESIDLEYNKIGDVGAQALAEATKSSSSLTWIKLGGNKIGDVGAQALAEVIEARSSMTEVDLEGNKIGDLGAQALAEVFKVHPSIMRIKLDGNEFGLAGAEALARAIEMNPSIRSVKLSADHVGNKVLKLAHAISAIKFRERVEVELSFASLGDVDARALAEAIKMGSAIERIDLGSNQIGDVGAQALAEAAAVSSSLWIMNLGGNRIGNLGAQAVAEAVKTNSSMRSVDLSRNQIGDAGAEAFAAVIKMSSSIHRVELGHNEIGDVGAQALAQAFHLSSSKFLTLDLPDNNIYDAGAKALEAAASNCNLPRFKSISWTPTRSMLLEQEREQRRLEQQREQRPLGGAAISWAPYKPPWLHISAACTNVRDKGFLTVDLAAMGDNMSCSTHCAPNCISRQPPGHDVLEDPPRKSVGRTYPVADPVDLQLNWQTIAVRHAWRKAAEMGDTGIGRPEEGRPLRAAEPVKANAAEADDAPGRGIDVVKI